MRSFVIGFVIGAAAGATAVYLVYNPPGGAVGDMRAEAIRRMQQALEIGRDAAGSAERQLWDEFNRRVRKNPDEPRELPPAV